MRIWPKNNSKFNCGVYDILTGKNSEDSTLVRIYYPTDCEPNKTVWKPDSYASSLGRYATDKLPRVFGFLSSLFLANISVPQYEAKNSSDVAISKTLKKKETVIFSHGIWGNRFMYSYQF